MFYGLSSTWPVNPEAIVILLLLVVFYLLRLGRMRMQQKTVSIYRVLAFFSGIILAALVLLTPVDTIGRTQLFTVHIASLVVLVTVCSPLLLAGCPAVVLEPLIESPIVKQFMRVLTRPLLVSILFNVNFLLWHTPLIYNAAMADPALYHVQMLSIFLLSLLNWWPLIGSVQELRRMSYPVQMLYAFVDGQPVDIYAFVLVFCGVALYPHYVIPTEFALATWNAVPAQMGLTPFADQAAAGALLLVPGLVDLLVMTPLFFRWLKQIERRTEAADQERQRLAELEEEEEDEWEDEEELPIAEIKPQ
jgi:cytochrome c oxidase assembly factor CtaG